MEMGEIREEAITISSLAQPQFGMASVVEFSSQKVLTILSSITASTCLILGISCWETREGRVHHLKILHYLVLLALIDDARFQHHTSDRHFLTLKNWTLIFLFQLILGYPHPWTGIRMVLIRISFFRIQSHSLKLRPRSSYLHAQYVLNR